MAAQEAVCGGVRAALTTLFFVYLLQQQGASVKGCTHRCNAFSAPVPHTTIRTQDRMCMYYVSDYSKRQLIIVLTIFGVCLVEQRDWRHRQRNGRG